MKSVYIISDNITSPLGFTTGANFDALMRLQSGIKKHDIPAYLPLPFYASLFSESQKQELADFGGSNDFTFFEQLLIHSISEVARGETSILADKKTGLIISTTKGNISLLEQEPETALRNKRMALPYAARRVADHLGFVNEPIVVSHACISGLVALITGMRLLQDGVYENVVVAGADVITQFILSGFQSFHAISDEPCKPFDATRKGINLGEGAAAVVLSIRPGAAPHHIVVAGGAVSNDANHISGPSRTGAELHQAIESAVKEAVVDKTAIDFISAHGTATIYNDEMEAKAINLSNLQNLPVNSLKGYYGHTLGAAGLIETVASIQSLQHDIILPTLGFEQSGTSQDVKVSSILQPGNYFTCLKTASGFGGCNAAVILKKEY